MSTSSSSIAKFSLKCGVDVKALNEAFAKLKGTSEADARTGVVQALMQALVFKVTKKRGSGKTVVKSEVLKDGGCNRQIVNRQKKTVYCNQPARHIDGKFARCDACMKNHFFTGDPSHPVVETTMVTVDSKTAYLAKDGSCIAWAQEIDKSKRTCKLEMFTEDDIANICKGKISGEGVNLQCTMNTAKGGRCSRSASQNDEDGTVAHSVENGVCCPLCTTHAKAPKSPNPKSPK